jgi:hypothetical protein
MRTGKSIVGRRFLTRPKQKRVADSHRFPQPLHVGAHQNGRSIAIALSLDDITVRGDRNSLLDKLRGHFRPVHPALYLFSGAAVTAGGAVAGLGAAVAIESTICRRFAPHAHSSERVLGRKGIRTI